jgi:hypothetical protein
MTTREARKGRPSVNAPTGWPDGCPTPRSGPITQAVDDEAKKRGAWTVRVMNDDWKRIFAFESRP